MTANINVASEQEIAAVVRQLKQMPLEKLTYALGLITGLQADAKLDRAPKAETKTA